ncbi:nucleoid-associated protein [Sphingomonas sp. Xoc002]|uniref:nucleoid-associated protein n=1 Tax=Sphingomonas sp. Xoc002 TaxID=2837624 RepID=UPI003D1639CE
MNEIVALAIHDLERRAGAYTTKLAKKELPVSPTAQRVVEGLYDLYNRKASKSHGKFTEAEGYPTQGQIRDYVASDQPDFLALTSRMMETLRRQAATKSASAGGHVFFAQFKREARDYLLVAIITDKLSATLTANLDMEDVQHLDLDGFRFAGRINLTGWAAGEERYISFLKGKGDVSDYFKEFLGCDSAVQDRKDTADLVSALKDFVVDRKMGDAEGTEFLARAKAICERAGRSREELEFEALANELMPKEPQALVDHLSDGERRLNDRFVPNLQALRALVRFKAKTKQWSVEFEREALNGGVVRFDPKVNSLTLLDVPAELVAQLKSEGLTGA